MIMRFKIQRHYGGDEWEVYSGEPGADGESHFIGSLADCEAWIRLTESGRL